MRTVLILGCAQWSGFDRVHRKYRPDVWTINNCRPPKRYDLWSQLHGFETMVEAHGESYLLMLSELECPLLLFPKQASSWNSYMRKRFGRKIRRPTILDYPVKEAIALTGRKYHDNSFAWLIDLAILWRYDRIILAGVDYGGDVEKLWKVRRRAANIIEGKGKLRKRADRNLTNDLRGILAGDESWAIPCISYHMGIAQGRGIETMVLGEKNGIFYDKWGGLYGIHPKVGGL